QGAGHDDIIEKIDIGGISLIRAAAKNYNDVLIVSSREQYEDTLDLLNRHSGVSTLEDRRRYAAFAFDISSHYDSAIFNYMNQGVDIPSFKNSTRGGSALRYGENPHQRGWYYGNFSAYFSQINGKELSYNNLVDIDAAVSLVEEFEETTFVIIKHTNACGVANGATVKEAYLKALEADSVSAFGGILATNKEVDIEAAEEINKLFFEVLITPSVTKEAEVLLKSKKNRIILIQQKQLKEVIQFKSLMNGVLVQDKDIKTDNREDLKVVTRIAPSNDEIEALLFASKICKHSKSNTIVLAKKGQLLASGVGQTSRVDALNQAIEKAKAFGMNIEGSVMASDAFFPFPDCVEIGYNVGVKTVIQPGGSIKDQDSIDYCDKNGMAMVFSGHRHFLH
ncbi:MAG: bifunctional phosphoribosylaminoimidazolecarboxamide formyltransferase/IMP cyclohydrolase, partial [Cyclobacteriaceae bacterium]|nr:bifunctional phosphoribosylaminoimidazolecarboxamide formyltransferase/IMP cyclohydrolase [Cyclobacteriaceae bacterium]